MSSNPAVEIIRTDPPRGRFRAAIFDFDGTLSLLREGWPAVMSEMMLAELRRVGPEAGAANDAELVEEIVVGLNGRPTIVQMQTLAAEVIRRGGSADPMALVREYQDRLFRLIGSRYDEIRSGRVSPKMWAVPGVHAFLDALRARGIKLVLVSGTQVVHVRREAEMLGLLPYFGEAFFAPNGDDATFTKRAVIERVMAEHRLRGEELIGFGDGVVETEEVRRVGGVAVAVASAEPPARGVNPGKRRRLIQAGADVVIGDYECGDRLLALLFAEE
ncbi:MAG TPA: HAD family hydrolase [Gemmataceae bacterium]